MKRLSRPRVVVQLLAFAVWSTFGIAPALAEQVAEHGIADSAPADDAVAIVEPHVIPPALPAGAAGMTIQIDPGSGRLLKEPRAGVPLPLSPAQANAFSTFHQDLVETASPTPGGGVVVDLQGRFQNPLAATIDAEGKLTILHPEARPAPTQPR